MASVNWDTTSLNRDMLSLNRNMASVNWSADVEVMAVLRKVRKRSDIKV